MKKITLLFLLYFSVSLMAYAQDKPDRLSSSKPNILWIITDDHRADALECYNEATTGKKESALGYVSSPNINKLAKEGVMFVNAFTNSPVCGPSRGSMLSGRYPFRNGHYAFEQTHQEPDFVRPSIPQTLRKNGYTTTSFGKEGAYIFDWGPGQTFKDPGHYDYKVSFKHDLQKNDVGDYWGQPAYAEGTKWKNIGTEERVKTPDGKVVKYLLKAKKGQAEVSQEDLKLRKKMEDKYEILRSYTRAGNKDLIIGGENPMPAGQTIDGKIVEEFKLFLENQNTTFTNTYGETKKGVNSNKPLMTYLGFHLPHTPVLPPKSYRDIFKKKQYKIPAFSDAEKATFVPQLAKMYKTLNFTDMTPKEKQQAIQDYYAFCAYGDALIGESVDAFKKYCEKNNQEYLIVFVVGDHGWHLGEQGIEAKFTGWKQSTHGAMIVVSSNKNEVPEAIVNTDLVEYVDASATILESAGISIDNKDYDYIDGINLHNIINGKAEKRDYIVGETNVIVGHRAYLRSEDFAFSMRARPQNHMKLVPNVNVKWALTCPLEKAELALYDLRKDPLERKNVAADKQYQKLADWFRNKLGNIVLGDGRVECDWSKENVYNISNFAKGAHDGKLNIPSNLIPKN
ncbi:sulfatase-like hydrolase/transferase [Seonamhaeicola sp.]|uniref:sulfatase-like hydrolase/transferase n=1 Tax=Seonamhaeicola sp. TaxID=1912245 RepID=UPI002605F82E|nr:sulfatase-like hydrolase/transferase [Seonamhaeicola sp.]